MLRPLWMSLAIVAVSASNLDADEASPYISTWRWTVSALVEPQRADAARAARANYDQRYEEYLAN